MNLHRAVNIGLVTEINVVADRAGIDIFEVVDAAISNRSRLCAASAEALAAFDAVFTTTKHDAADYQLTRANVSFVIDLLGVY